MIKRKKRLRLIQLSLLIMGLLILYFTYGQKNINFENEIISKSSQEKAKQQDLSNEEGKGDVFFDIEYTGLDLNGNRYLLKSKEAFLDELKPEIVYMQFVNAIFYFKDGAADYKTYLNLTTFNGFNTNSLISADLITTLVALLKYLSLNDLNIILLFSLISLSGIIIFYKNLLKLGLEKKIALFFLFIPGIHFWTCAPGKDSLILLFLSCFF